MSLKRPAVGGGVLQNTAPGGFSVRFSQKTCSFSEKNHSKGYPGGFLQHPLFDSGVKSPEGKIRRSNCEKELLWF